MLNHALARFDDRTKSGKFEVNLADLVIELAHIRRGRAILQLIIAIEPRQTEGISAILGDGAGSLAEVAYAFGVSESTMNEQWIPAGMPMRVETETICSR